MMYVKNVPTWERIVRLLSAVAAIAYGLVVATGPLQWLVVAGAACLAMSSLLGFCPACAMVGRRLNK
ncbi:DUF2892 domain-containing protein [Herbaspirillum sp. GCM10030257]|uniref:YgaP family membrane protein n=1 Tax=Herbaspirillum sp. GCM10030257 TaxID=3273393 RepID=UPI00361A9139